MSHYNYPDQFYSLADALIYAGKVIDSKGWCPATSGNFSARLEDGTIAITVSGKHKGQLQSDDIMLVDALGNSLDGKVPSAETMLHIQLYQRFSDVNAVLHTHSLNSTLISMQGKKKITLKNYELLKVFSGITTHESRVVVPIFANSQNIAQLSENIDDYMDSNDEIYAYLIEGHGLYTWGDSIEESLRYLDALDFLFTCELRS
ncbi:methylthioribulose-1-phosphate dehydratase [Methylococcaceae bacterium]|nr:methylthioribulose-1-phosphate dehydratase [Methylococcaceae bacterium]